MRRRRNNSEGRGVVEGGNGFGEIHREWKGATFLWTDLKFYIVPTVKEGLVPVSSGDVRVVALERKYPNVQLKSKNSLTGAEHLYRKAGTVRSLHLLLHQDSRPAAGSSGHAALFPSVATDRPSDDTEPGEVVRSVANHGVQRVKRPSALHSIAD